MCWAIHLSTLTILGLKAKTGRNSGSDMENTAFLFTACNEALLFGTVGCKGKHHQLQKGLDKLIERHSNKQTVKGLGRDLLF